MARSKATRSRTGRKAYQRVLKFPEAKGKIIADVELCVSSDYYLVEVRFSDKTLLVFDIEPCVCTFTELLDGKTGTHKLLREWRPQHSVSSRS